MNPTVILGLAPTGGWGNSRDNPLEPGRIRDEVAASAELGVTVAHLHARDAEGALTKDIDRFLETCRLVREACDVVIEASTGGLSGLTAAERALTLLAPEAETASFNMGSLNFGDQVYRNSLPDIRFWLAEMKARGKKPVMELFDTGMVEIARAMHAEAGEALGKPLLYNFIFDCKWGMRYSKPLLACLVERIQAGALWGTAFVAYEDFSRQIETLLLGASWTRVGFEDSRFADGMEAGSNLGIVRALRTRLDAAGLVPATAAQTRSILGLRNRS